MQAYFRYFSVLGHYLFLKADSFPRAMLLENCLLLRTDNLRTNIQAYFLCQMETIVYLSSHCPDMATTSWSLGQFGYGRYLMLPWHIRLVWYRYGYFGSTTSCQSMNHGTTKLQWNPDFSNPHFFEPRDNLNQKSFPLLSQTL